jgi:hypothetical protein
MKHLKNISIFGAGFIFGSGLFLVILLSATKRIESTLFPNSHIEGPKGPQALNVETTISRGIIK